MRADGISAGLDAIGAALNLRRVVLEMLAAHEDPRFSSPYLPAAVRRRAQVTEAEVWEMLWQLVAEGLVYLDPSGQHSSTDNWRWKLSRRGEVAAAGGVVDPYDPDGYLDRLRQQIPNIDPIVELYAGEALRAFVAQCYLASSVMLGVASEQAFLGMAEAFCASLDGSEGKNLGTLLDSPRTTSRPSSRRYASGWSHGGINYQILCPRAWCLISMRLRTSCVSHATKRATQRGGWSTKTPRTPTYNFSRATSSNWRRWLITSVLSRGRGPVQLTL